MADYNVDFVALGRLLLHLVPARPPYVVTIDCTEWNFGDTPVNVLVAAVACKGTAVPIAWVALDHGGGSGAASHLRLLGRLLSVLGGSASSGDAAWPAGAQAIGAVVADREFISARLLGRLQEHGIPFAIRLRSDRRVGLSAELFRMSSAYFIFASQNRTFIEGRMESS
jgi:hypothetical protein